MVGTMWVWVTPWRSISSSVSAAFQRFMSTTVWPRCSDIVTNRPPAAWYMGPAQRCTLPSWG